MKKEGGKIAVTAVFTVLIAVATLVFAAVLDRVNTGSFDTSYHVSSQSTDKDESSKPNSTVQSQASSENSPQEDENSSAESEESIPELVYPVIETGLYTRGENTIVISYYEAGFIEGNINCGGITMEFSGQMVENSLTATGTDSLNNTVEIVLVFNEKTIDTSCRPVIQYEEGVEHLTLDGIYEKQE